MDEPSPSSSCNSTAVAVSPSRIQRGGRQGSENMASLLSPSTPVSPSQGQSRGPSRAKWLLLQSCFVLLVLASVVLFSMDAQRIRWVSKLLHRTGPAAPAPAFQAGAPVHLRKAAAGARTPEQDKADAAAFLKGTHALDWRPEEYSSRVGGGIPKILHHIFLDGEDEYGKAVEAAKAVGSGFKREWRDSCLRNHSDWKHMFWDKAAALTFLGAHYPWFIGTFNNYPKVVLQGDALRPFLLHAFGGLYVDLDVQCFRSSAAWLAPYTLVLQSEYKEGRDIVNSVMASVPGHPFWKAIIGQMIQQIGAYGDQMNSDIILESTGPRLYSAVYHNFVPLSAREKRYPGELQMGQSKIRVYGLGEWFVPCVWNDEVCHKAMAVEVQAGRIPKALAGHHQYSGSWLSTVPRGKRRS